MHHIKQACRLLATTLLFTTSIASAQTLDWATTSPANEVLSGFPVAERMGKCTAMDTDGNMLLVGYSITPPGAWHDIVVRKIRADGSWAWSTYRNAPEGGLILATGIAVDAAGDVYVSGYLDVGPGSNAFMTIKYDGETGVQLWERQATNNSHFMNQANRVAVDHAGNAFAAGTEYHAGIEFRTDFLIVKYQGSSGNELWRASYPGIDTFVAEVTAIAIDGNGDVVIGATSGSNLITVKFDGDTGQQLWAREFPIISNADTNENLAALVVDGDGNVIVTGSTLQPDASSNVVTLKYAGSDGSTLWEREYDGAASDDDLPRAMAVDSSGNITIAGTSVSAESGNDFLTLHYGNDGTLLWSRRFSTTNTNNESLRAVTLDDHGNPFVTGGTIGPNGNFDFTVLGYAAETGRQAMRFQQGFVEGGTEQSFAMNWVPDGSLRVAGSALSGETRIGVMKINVPMFADAFEAEGE